MKLVYQEINLLIDVKLFYYASGVSKPMLALFTSHILWDTLLKAFLSKCYPGISVLSRDSWAPALVLAQVSLNYAGVRIGKHKVSLNFLIPSGS